MKSNPENKLIKSSPENVLKYKAMNTNIVIEITKRTGLNQKQIADRLGVSTSTVSAWSKNAPIPRVKQAQLQQLGRMIRRINRSLDGHTSSWKLFAKSPGNSRNWHFYMQNLGVPLHPDWQKLLLALNDRGVPIPKKAPNVIELDSSNAQISGDDRHNEPTDEGVDFSIDIDIHDYKQHKTFDKLVRELLDSLNILDSWCDTFLPRTKEGELIAAAQKIKNRLVDVSFLNEKVVDLATSLGSNLIEKNIQNRREVITLISFLCEVLLATERKIETDYFEFVKLHPDRLRKRIDQHETRALTSEPHINDYLRYGEKKIANKVEQTSHLQKRLLQSIETLTKTQSELVERIQKNEQLLKQIIDKNSAKEKARKDSRKDDDIESRLNYAEENLLKSFTKEQLEEIRKNISKYI